MQYDFNRVIDRRNTNSIKYDFAEEYGLPTDVIPLWVADMDFQAPPAVLEALHQTVDHGIFGYSDHKQDYVNVLHNWFMSRFKWDFEDNWLVKTPGVVYAMSTAVRALTKPGEAVIIQQPVYHPFASMVESNNRKLVINRLYRLSDRTDNNQSPTEESRWRSDEADTKSANDYVIDLEDFERQIIENNVRLFFLCSPQNPLGRVWTEQELRSMGEICLRHNVIVVADEIHADFIYPGHQHTIFSSLSPELSDITILCTAPSKTFNLAGLQAANIFIANDSMRRKFKAEMNRTGYGPLSITGLRAAQAAYEYGGEWLEQLQQYLEQNLKWLESFLTRELSQVKLVRPEGTYLVWLDFRALMPDDKTRKEFLLQDARIWLNEGTLFGQAGSGYERVNIACPRATLEEAMYRLKEAVARRFEI